MGPARHLWAYVLAALAGIGGCKQKSDSEVYDSVIESVIGDPQKGYFHLVNSDYMGCGIPSTLFSGMAGLKKAPPVGLKNYIAPTFEGDLKMAKPDLPGREGRNAELPFYLNAWKQPSGVEVVNLNCLACHAEKIQGKVVVGLGNVTRDWSESLAAVTEAPELTQFLAAPAEQQEWGRWTAAMKGVAPYLVTETVGANPAVSAAYAAIAHTNRETLQRSPSALMELPAAFVPPVDVPPWWRLKYRSTVFYNGEYQGDHRRYLMLATLACIDGGEAARKVEKIFYHIDAYATSIEAPKYPFKVDHFLASAGKDIYQQHCAGCHGSYSEQGLQYQENVVAWDDVNTDPELWRMQFYESSRFHEWVNSSWYGEIGNAKPSDGYVSPPLAGIWASGPYFHNGSVPTLEGVLDSSRRPKYWRRPSTLAEYDESSMGWEYRDLASSKERMAVPKQFLYDTTKKGYGSGGHTYGDKLRAAERKALLEFLKTL